jgi:HSP20 family protein
MEVFMNNRLALYRPNNFNPLMDIDRLVDSFFGNHGLDHGLSAALPPVDVRETPDSYVLEAELPGYTEGDIEVHLDGGTITIESKKDDKAEKSVNDGAGGNYLIRERRRDGFRRSFKLPETADLGAIEADFKDGLLSLNIKKRTETQKRVIEIKSKAA